MDKSINFPNLGIHLENVGKTVSFFGFKVAYYGIVIGFAMLVGMYIASVEAKKSHQDPDMYYDLSIYGIFFAIIGARIYYVAFSWADYKDNLLSIFNLRGGGLAIYGGIIGAVITVLVFARRRGISAGLLLDTACPGIIAGQMIGRWGNFFNREAFGAYTDGLFAMQLPVDAVRQHEITTQMWDHVKMLDGTAFIQVHPTFLYESLWCLGGFIVLLKYREKKAFDGEVFHMYLFLYAAGRVWIEGLRTDQLQFKNGIAVSQLLAAGLLLYCPVRIIWGRRRAKKTAPSKR